MKYTEDYQAIDIPGVDTAKGLSLCDGDRGLYRAVLRSYVADISGVIRKIRDVTVETLPGYAIAVHGIKGSSANIGAESVRETASGLETMVHSGDLQGVLAVNSGFLDDTARILAAINSWLKSQEDKTVKPRRNAPDAEVLARLRRSCDEYDSVSIEKAMDELDSARYDTDNDLVVWLRERVDMYDFAEAAKKIAEYEADFHRGNKA